MGNTLKSRKSLIGHPIYLNKELDYARVMEEEWESGQPLTRLHKFVLTVVGFFLAVCSFYGLLMGLSL